MQKMNIAIGADGRGSTFEEIVKATHGNGLNARVVALFTNKKQALVVAKAVLYSIPVLILEKEKSRQDRDSTLYEFLKNHTPRIDFVCLAGYLRRIPQCVIDVFPRRIINSHPALDLYRFGGKGMYGTHVTKAVIAAGLKETGSSIHVVSSGELYDDPQSVIACTGLIPIFSHDTPESLLGRQLPAEQALYLDVIRQFCKDIALVSER